jgi:hypothetical protein
VKRWAGIAALVCIASASQAAPARLWFEPAAFGIERLDPVWAASGVERTAAHIGAGIGYDLGRGWTLAAAIGCAAGRTDFGLLEGPGARLVRSDARLELRARAPFEFGGWSVQAAVGGGRLRTAYRPDAIVLATSGGALEVDLPPVHAWTRHVAAEVLHAWAQSTLFVRAGWRWYGFDVATPGGIERRGVRDAQFGCGMRVAVF